LIDLTNNLAYLVSLNRSLVGAFSNPSIQNADFGDLEEEGLKSSTFRRIIALQILSSTNKELIGQLIKVISNQNKTVFINGIDESQAV
jgi:hypothetical protein